MHNPKILCGGLSVPSFHYLYYTMVNCNVPMNFVNKLLTSPTSGRRLTNFNNRCRPPCKRFILRPSFTGYISCANPKPGFNRLHWPTGLHENYQNISRSWTQLQDFKWQPAGHAGIGTSTCIFKWQLAELDKVVTSTCQTISSRFVIIIRIWAQFVFTQC